MIEIAARLRPFSHLPHTRCLVPGTDIVVDAAPARLVLRTLGGRLLEEREWPITGPLRGFTVMQDLERGCVTLFSDAYRMHILQGGDIVTTKAPPLPERPVQERLSLGAHKKQEWEGIRRRGEWSELLPLWFRLGSFYNTLPKREESEGIFSLLTRCREAIAAPQPEHILTSFRALFLAGFGGLWVPRLWDEDYQGILPTPTTPPEGNPLYLLQEGAQLIRALFVEMSENACTLLPHLPPELPCGRMTRLRWPSYGELDLEWTKKAVRRLVLRAEREGRVVFHLRTPLRTFRLRGALQERGVRLSSGEAIEIKSGCQYVLDQFQK